MQAFSIRRWGYGLVGACFVALGLAYPNFWREAFFVAAMGVGYVLFQVGASWFFQAAYLNLRFDLPLPVRFHDGLTLMALSLIWLACLSAIAYWALSSAHPGADRRRLAIAVAAGSIIYGSLGLATLWLYAADLIAV